MRPPQTTCCGTMRQHRLQLTGDPSGFLVVDVDIVHSGGDAPASALLYARGGACPSEAVYDHVANGTRPRLRLPRWEPAENSLNNKFLGRKDRVSY